MRDSIQTAPRLAVKTWFNTAEPLSLDALRGRVVVVEAFQMLCPGCVSHGLPQVQQVRRLFESKDVAVIGLHCVFEHHAAQGPLSLKAFLHEYRITFPVGVDSHDENSEVPKTMAAYAMQGTPTLVLIDRLGRRRAQHFGQIADIHLGAEIMALVAESDDGYLLARDEIDREIADCDNSGCPAPGRSVDEAKKKPAVDK